MAPVGTTTTTMVGTTMTSQAEAIASTGPPAIPLATHPRAQLELDRLHRTDPTSPSLRRRELEAPLEEPVPVPPQAPASDGRLSTPSPLLRFPQTMLSPSLPLPRLASSIAAHSPSSKASDTFPSPPTSALAGSRSPLYGCATHPRTFFFLCA